MIKRVAKRSIAIFVAARPKGAGELWTQARPVLILALALFRLAERPLEQRGLLARISASVEAGKNVKRP
jgi:hypothetical protein